MFHRIPLMNKTGMLHLHLMSMEELMVLLHSFRSSRHGMYKTSKQAQQHHSPQFGWSWYIYLECFGSPVNVITIGVTCLWQVWGAKVLPFFLCICPNRVWRGAFSGCKDCSCQASGLCPCSLWPGCNWWKFLGGFECIDQNAFKHCWQQFQGGGLKKGCLLDYSMLSLQ